MDQAAVEQDEQNQKGLSTADLARASDQKAAATDNAPARPVQPMGTDGHPAALLAAGDLDKFRSEWNNIQIGFVDEPRKSVEQADTLVAEVMKRLAETFAQERANLEDQWNSGNNVSTEDLRQALRRYRSFFDRLLSV